MEGWPKVAKSLDHSVRLAFGCVLLSVPVLSAQMGGFRICGRWHSSLGHSEHSSNEKLHSRYQHPYAHSR
jgi:hypothetical protein